VLCAFDMIALDGEDLRWARLEDRKDTLATLLRDAGDGIAFNKHFDGDGEIIFRHACSLGCEGIGGLLGWSGQAGKDGGGSLI
jgi:bifunctional non-homologous end joining protein LigD